MSEVIEKPLLTFAVCAYQQERFIREAVEGAFAQTYSPLQVILSDDASSDRTFEIMTEMASTYSGPHRIILNRNQTNRGLGGHINRLMELCEGEVMIAAAGDDISVPNRVAALFERWDKAGRPVGSIFSDTIEVEEDGTRLNRSSVPHYERIDLSRIFRGAVLPVIGSTHAWHRRVFEVFGPLRDEVVNEDSAIFYRSALLGSVLHIYEPLVHHRIHSDNTGGCGRSVALTPEKLLQVWKTSFNRGAALFANLLMDLRRFQTLGGAPKEVDLWIQEATRGLEFNRRAEVFVSVGVFTRLRMLLPLFLQSRSSADKRILVTQCLFPSLNLMIRPLKQFFRSVIRREKHFTYS